MIQSSFGKIKKAIFPYWWHLPSFIVLGVLLGYPLFYSFFLSFRSLNLLEINNAKFVGMSNYAELLNDPEFWTSFGNTMIFVALSVTFEFFLGLALAILFDKVTKGTRFVQTVALIPMMMTPVVVALLWKFIYHPNFGILNFLLNCIGLKGMEWLGDSTLAMPSIIIVEVWQFTAFAILVFLAGLKTIPEDPYEAAKIDGASPWQCFRFITWPLLRSSMLIILVIRTLFALRIFDTVYTLTSGGPANSTMVLSLFIYRIAFRYFKISYASALAWVMVLLSAIISIVYVKILRNRGD